MQKISKVKVLETPHNCHELSIDYDGFNYLVIFGTHVNGGFFLILNHGVCGDLANYNDEFWNAESIGRALGGDYNTGKAIAHVIAQYGR